MSFRFDWALLDGTPVAVEGAPVVEHVTSSLERACECEAHCVARIGGGLATVEGVGRLQFLAGVGQVVPIR
jgi:hypothetical protein